MKLSEVLDSGVEYTVVKSTPVRWEAEAEIGGRLIRVVCKERDRDTTWVSKFEERAEGGHASHKLTGSGSELKVFAMVKAALTQFVREYQPEAMEFTADNTESTTRAALYDRLFSRFNVPGYRYMKRQREEKTFFWLFREAKIG